MCAPTKQNAGFWLKSSKSHQVLHILLYGQAQLLFFPIGEAPFLLGGFCMPVPMARSSAKRLAFFVTNMYDCAHGEVICKATSIFRHKFVWLYPWRGHVENDQYFWPPICMTVPMARSSAKRPAFFVTNLYDCTHGEVICNATSIFRHQFVWLYPWREVFDCSLLFTFLIFFLVFASFDLHDFDRSTKTPIFIDEKRWVV